MKASHRRFIPGWWTAAHGDRERWRRRQRTPDGGNRGRPPAAPGRRGRDHRLPATAALGAHLHRHAPDPPSRAEDGEHRLALLPLLHRRPRISGEGSADAAAAVARAARRRVDDRSVRDRSGAARDRPRPRLRTRPTQSKLRRLARRHRAARGRICLAHPPAAPCSPAPSSQASSSPSRRFAMRSRGCTGRTRSTVTTTSPRSLPPDRVPLHPSRVRAGLQLSVTLTADGADATE